MWKDVSATVKKTDERPVLVVRVVVGRIKWVPGRTGELLQLLRIIGVLQVVIATFSNDSVVVSMSDGVEGAEMSRRYRSKDLVPFPVGVRSLVANSREDEDKGTSGRQNVFADTFVRIGCENRSLRTQHVHHQKHRQHS